MTPEYIEITFSAANHTWLGDLEVTLTNDTTGTISLLAEQHFCSGGCTGPYNGWVFGTARHLGEMVDGNWTLKVADLFTADTGTFQSWEMTFHYR